MANVRYYDYGVIRREADRRMYNAQHNARRSAACSAEDTAKSDCTEPCREPVCGCSEEVCAQEKAVDCAPLCPEAADRKGGIGVEELLIIALLLLALNEENCLPLALVLLYLLM